MKKLFLLALLATTMSLFGSEKSQYKFLYQLPSGKVDTVAATDGYLLDGRGYYTTSLKEMGIINASMVGEYTRWYASEWKLSLTVSVSEDTWMLKTKNGKWISMNPLFVTSIKKLK
jgi:hypothetical protein